MCRIPRVLLVAPEDRVGELRRELSSLEYEIVAAIPPEAGTEGITADVAIAWEPDPARTARLKDAGYKVVAVGGNGQDADLSLGTDDVGTFKTRIWELFRPS